MDFDGVPAISLYVPFVFHDLPTTFMSKSGFLKGFPLFFHKAKVPSSKVFW